MLRFLLSHLAAGITVAASVLVAVHLLSTRRTSQSLLAWLIALVFLPPITIPLYLMFGTRKVGRAPRLRSPASIATDASLCPVARVLLTSGLPPPRGGNDFTLLGDGVAAYQALLALIAGAERSIDMTMFILADDAVGRAVVDALVARARAGVSVRVILDAVGSRGAASRAAKLLSAAGGDVRLFMPLLHLPTRGSSNLRSHRKLIVVDEARVLVGGMNLAEEYMGPTPLATRWRDLAALVEGPIAEDTVALFASDWAFCGGAPRAPTAPASQRSDPGALLQIVKSGPDVPDDALYDGLLTAIYGARERVWMVTPYYVPDELLQRALLLSVRRGVQTRLIMPSRSNHSLADFARRGLLRELRDGGVEIWGYTAGMVHAKAMIVDRDFAFVGSPNLDMRSLYLNYEDALFAYGEREVESIAAFLESLRQESTEGAFELRKRWWLIEQLARLVAPEL